MLDIKTLWRFGRFCATGYEHFDSARMHWLQGWMRLHFIWAQRGQKTAWNPWIEHLSPCVVDIYHTGNDESASVPPVDLQVGYDSTYSSLFRSRSI